MIKCVKDYVAIQTYIWDNRVTMNTYHLPFRVINHIGNVIREITILSLDYMEIYRIEEK